MPYAGRRGVELATGGFGNSASIGSGLDAYAADATLMAIVSGSAESVSQVGWKLWRKAASGKHEDRVEVQLGQHPAVGLWARPNAFTTGQEFVEAGIQHFELTGEWYWVIQYDPRFPTLPIGMWSVRPDRMTPVKDHDNFLIGWIYSFQGEDIPLLPREVIQIRRPNPNDPYRGLAPIVGAMPDAEANRLAAEWARNFFYNSAAPGGIIEVDTRLSDPEFRELRMRWNEQHRGVAQAHRVAILEQGKWVDRKYSIRDMDFTALRGFSGEQIRMAYRYPKPMLGTVEDVNRANAEAAEYVYAKWYIVARLERMKATLNQEFLPLFGPETPTLFEWDYESPVPEDAAQELAELTGKVNAAKTLVGMGYDHVDVEDYLGLPAMKYEKPEPVVLGPGGAPAKPGQPQPKQDPPKETKNELPELVVEPLAIESPQATGGLVRAAAVRARRLWTPQGEAAERLDPEEMPDLSETQASWETALAALLAAWAAIEAAQQSELLDLIRHIAEGGDVTAVAGLVPSWDAAAEQLTESMTALARIAVGEMIAEAALQDVELPTVVPDPIRLAALGNAYASTLARELGISAASETTRLYRPGIGADELTERVGIYLDDLTDARPTLYLGGALTAAQNAGRTAALAAGPTAAYYAAETLDRNTCKPCRQVNGRWLGNSVLKDVLTLYPTGGYVDCLGRLRCRGMVTAVWRPGTTGEQ